MVNRERSDGGSERGEGGAAEQERAPLGILFLAAAGALALLLAIVGLVAFLAMSPRGGVRPSHSGDGRPAASAQLN